MIKKIIISDTNNHSVGDNDLLLIWNDFTISKNNANVISIPDFIETNSEFLKENYLAWIFEFGNSIVRNKSIIQKLKIRDNLSYWWMTNLALKKNAFSSPPGITDAIKLLAFEKIAKDISFQEILYLGSNKSILLILKNWCKINSKIFNSSHIKHQKFIYNNLIIYNLVSVIKTLVWFFYYIIRQFPFLVLNNHKQKKNSNTVTFFNYFDNLDKSYVNNNQFKSLYWGNLKNITDLYNLKQDWVHLFITSDTCPNPNSALRLLKNNSDKNTSHEFMEGSLTLGILFRTIKDYFKIFSFGLRILNVKYLFSPEDSNLNFWPLFSREWNDSFYGKTAFENALYINLFEKILISDFSGKHIGVYLQENQAWEIAMISAWERGGNGNLIGFPHSSVRFWDLRYFYDKRTHDDLSDLKVPSPTLFAVNSKLTFNLFKFSGYNIMKLFEVEALRYISLSNLMYNQTNSIKLKDEYFKILIIGDYYLVTTLSLINCLLESLINFDIKYKILYKPHPNCGEIGDLLIKNNVKIVEISLIDALELCDVVFSSNSTSGSIDAILYGKPVITLFDPCYLNLSPFKGTNDVYFVKSANELSLILLKLSIEYCQLSRDAIKLLFNLDDKLSGWNRLFKSCLNDNLYD